MAGLSISRAWDETKARIAADGKLMMAVAAALVLLPQTIVVLVGPPEMLSGATPGRGFNLLVFAAAMAGLVAQIAVVRLAIGPATSVGESIGHGARRLLPAFGALFLIACLLVLAAIPVVLLLVGVEALEAAAAGAPPAGVGLAMLVIVILAILIGARFLMIIPVASTEAGGPIRILKRSWELASGQYPRLVGFILLVVVVVLIFSLAVQLGAGTVVNLFFDISPFSVGALAYGLVFGAVQAAYSVVISVLLARIYLQLAGRDSLEVSVPSSGT